MISKSEFLSQVHGNVFHLLKKDEEERQKNMKIYGLLLPLISLGCIAGLIWGTDIQKNITQFEHFYVLGAFLSLVPFLVGIGKIMNCSVALKKKIKPLLLDLLGLKEILVPCEMSSNKPQELKPFSPQGTNIPQARRPQTDSAQDLFDKHLSQKIAHWKKEEFISKKINVIDADDCFQEKRGRFQVFELSLGHQGRRDVNEIFEGFSLEFNTKIKLESKILIFQNLPFFSGKKITPKKSKKIRLNQRDFEKVFTVYATNESQAKVVLTPAFLNKILSIKKMYPKGILNVLIEKEKITLTVNTGKDMFEFFTYSKSLLTNQFFEKFYGEIKPLYQIYDLLNFPDSGKEAF